MKDVKRFLNNLKEKAIENPVLTVVVATAAVTAAAKLIEASGNRAGSVAYAKDVERRLAAANTK